MATKTKTTPKVQVKKQTASNTPIVLMSIFALVLAFLLAWCWRGHVDVVTTCKAGDISLSMGGSSGAAGTIYRNAVITNNGTKDCTLTGYTGAYLLDGGGVQLGNGAMSNSLYTPTEVTLAAGGGKAHTVLGFPQAGNFDPGVCTDNSAKLELFLPGVAMPLKTNLAQANCPGFSATAIKAGAGSY